MTKSVWALLTFGALVLGACSTPGRLAVDSGISLPDGNTGTTDTGGIMVDDSGGGGADSGGGRVDSGGGGGSCTLTVAEGNFGSLSAACFPRCARSTLTAVMECGMDAACQQAALQADTTATTPLTANGMAAPALNCATCVQTQQLHCASANGCPDEVDQFTVDCATAGDPCNTAIMALQTCINANATAVGTCQNSATMGIVACFGT